MQSCEAYNLDGHNEKADNEIIKIILVELGWIPTTMFKDSIKLTIQWYKGRMDWMKECTSGNHKKYYEEMYEIK